MKNIIFISQTIESCGIGIIGKLFGEALQKSEKYNIVVVYSENVSDLERKTQELSPAAIIYNYSSGSTPWVEDKGFRKKNPNIKHIIIHHDMNQWVIDGFSAHRFHEFEYIISPDETLSGSKNVFPVGRLIKEIKLKNSIRYNIPVIGSQGFGAMHKGFWRVAKQVFEEFDEAIIRLHIPPAYYGSSLGEAHERIREVREIVKPNKKIIVEASHNFMSMEEVIHFLSQNTINCYFYDELHGAGIASSPDAALAAKRPIAVTKSFQLRNFRNLNPTVCIEDTTLKKIIESGTQPLEVLYDRYSEHNFIRNVENALDIITS